MALKQAVQAVYRGVVDDRLRDAFWAWRSRGDSSVASGVTRGLVGASYPVGSAEEHLAATLDWLRAAQDACGDGVSAFYDMREGRWCPPYPETTGYIIPTFYDAAADGRGEEYRDRARRMAEWLLGLQLADGAFPIGPLWPGWERRPLVFDTGQIIHGLVRAHEETRDSRYLDSAARAGRWLASVQDEDGAWRRFTPFGVVQTYDVRTAFGLARLYQATGEEAHRRTAMRNLEFAVRQQGPDGYYRHMEFRAGEDALTHTIAYTVEGVLESGVLLGETALVASATLAAGALAERQHAQGYLTARYGERWESATCWSCPTGTAQMAMCWFRLFELTGQTRFRDAAVDANRHVKSHQRRDAAAHAGVRGGVSGSWPIWEAYEPYRMLNWAAKFFADSLRLEKRLTGSHGHARPVH